MKCPICGSQESERKLILNCGNLDNSKLYQYVKILKCKVCGHIYNELTQNEMENLIKYYKEEYSTKNLASSSGDRPGSQNFFSLKRYENLFDIVSPHINKNSRILDVGCAMGGFLDFLSKKGFKNLFGIDMIDNYVDYANRKNIKLGSAYSIPFKDSSLDLIILDQVLEHLEKPLDAIAEIKKALSDDGMCCMGVPDVSRYNETAFFENYWFLLREHIQHFDIEHLKLLMPEFELIDYKKTKPPMLSSIALLPNLTCLFKINTQYKPLDIYCWGIGREFLYLYENTNLRLSGKLHLVDDVIKDRYTVDGMGILDSSVLSKASKKSVLLITAIAHKELLTKKAIEIGYKGKIIDDQ